jgi:hypothetical protein
MNTTTTTTETALLSKWWRTESAQRAFDRAKEQRQARIAKVRAEFNAKQEKLAQDVEDWSEQ